MAGITSDVEILEKEILKKISFKPKRVSSIEQEASEYFAFMDEPPEGAYSVQVTPKNKVADEF